MIVIQFLYVNFRYKEMKINNHDVGHMTKMAAMLIIWYKCLKHLVSRNQWVDSDETLYVASEIQAHCIWFKC